MEPLQSENCLPTLGSMLDPKFSTTNSNTAKDGVMSTQIEKLVDEFVEIIARQVVHELNTRASLNTEYGERLAALEAKTHHFTFKKLDDLQVEVQGLRDCNAANLQVMRSQQEKIDHLENILARREVTSLSKTQVESIVEDAFEKIDIDYKIEWAIRDSDFSDTVKDTVESELEYKGFIDEEDLQRYLDHHRFLTDGSLIKFLNDRVRISVE